MATPVRANGLFVNSSLLLAGVFFYSSAITSTHVGDGQTVDVKAATIHRHDRVDFMLMNKQ